MVQLFLSTTKGNAGIRHFPYQGYLGLTPVRVDGIVRTRCDEDQKPVQASALTVYVRAYESRQTRLGAPHSRIVAEYSQTVWRKPDGQDYGSLGDFDSPFKITLPKRAAGFSTANYQDYRSFWRVEAVLEHLPSPTVGSRIVKYFELALIRYDIPPPLPPPSPSPQATYASSSSSAGPTLPHVTTKPRAPLLYYNLSTPPYPIGPSDLLFTSLFIRAQDPAVSIRSASLLVERRIELMGTDFPSTGNNSPHMSLLTLPPQIMLSTSLPERDYMEYATAPTYSTLAGSHSTSTLQSTASASTTTSRTPLLPLPTSQTHLPPPSPPPTAQSSLTTYSQYNGASHSSGASPITPSSPTSPSEKVHTTTVAAASFSSFSLDPSTGVYSKTVSLPWPESRSHARWSMGETMKGSLGSVSFWVRVKVIVTSPTTGTETIDLAPRELSVVLTNDAERRQAVAHFAEAHARSVERRRAATAPGSSSTISAQPTGGDKGARDPPSTWESTSASAPYVPPKSGELQTIALASSTSPPPPPVPRMSSASDSRTKPHAAPRKKSRRPHTSAGPQDRGGRDSMDVPMPMPVLLASGTVALNLTSAPNGGVNGVGMVDTTNLGGGGRPSPPYPYLYMKPQSPTSTASPSTHQQQPRASSPPKVRAVHSPNGTGRLRGSVEVVGANTGAGGGGPGTEVVRAWEEELARIEKASKRGSQDMLGFWRRRERTREREQQQPQEVRMPR